MKVLEVCSTLALHVGIVICDNHNSTKQYSNVCLIVHNQTHLSHDKCLHIWHQDKYWNLE